MFVLCFNNLTLCVWSFLPWKFALTILSDKSSNDFSPVYIWKNKAYLFLDLRSSKLSQPNSFNIQVMLSNLPYHLWRISLISSAPSLFFALNLPRTDPTDIPHIQELAL